jgi:Protein of unknown function (DUF2442)
MLDDKISNVPATDPLDRLVFEEGLRIKSVWFDKDLDLIVVLLNTKKIIKRPLSDFKLLASASLSQLENFENEGTEIHWPTLNEDISLRGLLKYELMKIDLPLAS